MKRTSLYYILILVVVGLAIYGVLQMGSHLPAPGGQVIHAGRTVAQEVPHLAMLHAVEENLSTPLSHLFLQLLVIIVVSRVTGRIFTAFGQPAVVGEMVAGILLGPSLFGWMMPQAFEYVFPPKSLGTLMLLSQIGVCLFMFVVGMELNMSQVRNKAHTAVLVSHASIIFPYLLGVALAYLLYTEMAAPGASFLAFALFMGISMSITAFPVLARILQERGLTRTPLGSTAITCAAVDDVTAWSILAFVMAIVKAGSLLSSGLNLLLVAVFFVLMVYGVKRLLPTLLGARALEEETPSRTTLVVVICVVIGAALCTEAIGIHALFGAFLAGAIMPEIGGFRHKLTVRVENFSSVLLLPLFFVFTGLRTQIGLLGGAQDWLICLLICVVATLGKLGGSALAARLTGMDWRNSLSLGALMNTRGLMELIVLNIGYDLGILSPRIFAMLVIMAVVTTMLTGPLLTLFKRKEPEVDAGIQPVRP